jgi:putative ABC transport system ATP-binding protein
VAGPAPLIALQGVHRTFERGRVSALEGVDLTIATGESIALVGKSGSGKSSLLHIATGLDAPGRGRVLWQGAPIESRRRWAALRRNEIGIVFQDFHLLPTLTARQNVELALMGAGLSGAEQHRRAEAALERVGLGHRLHQLPSMLSGGERQRVAIARALVREPLVLFADEPTGNLDSASAEAVFALLFELHRQAGATLVLVTHDDDLAARCGRLVRLADGRIVEDRVLREGAAA